MKPTIIVMSHGNFANEILNSAKMIIGEFDRVYPICMKEDDGLSGTAAKLDELLSGISGEVLIIADLFGGTPANVAVMKAAASPNIKVVTGLNLGMLVEAILSVEEDTEKLAKTIVDAGQLAIRYVVPDVSDDEEFEDE